MFYACIPLFSYMGTNLGQMPAAAALRLLRLRLRLRLRLEIPAADRGTVKTLTNTVTFHKPIPPNGHFVFWGRENNVTLFWSSVDFVFCFFCGNLNLVVNTFNRLGMTMAAMLLKNMKLTMKTET